MNDALPAISTTEEDALPVALVEAASGFMHEARAPTPEQPMAPRGVSSAPGARTMAARRCRHHPKPSSGG